MGEENNNGSASPSRKDAAIGRLRKRYPDKKFEDEEEIYGQMSDDYDALESENARYKAEQDALYETLADDGGDLAERLLSAFGNSEVKKRREENKVLEEEWRKSEAERDRTLAEFQDEHGLTDEQLDAVWDGLLGILTDFLHGKVSKRTLETIKSGIDHDADVAAAGHEGEVRGRNAKIEERLARSKAGDGLGNLQAGHNGLERRRTSIFDDAAMAR